MVTWKVDDFSHSLWLLGQLMTFSLGQLVISPIPHSCLNNGSFSPIHHGYLNSSASFFSFLMVTWTIGIFSNSSLLLGQLVIFFHFLWLLGQSIIFPFFVVIWTIPRGYLKNGSFPSPIPHSYLNNGSFFPIPHGYLDNGYFFRSS